jgi:hypothetical protein
MGSSEVGQTKQEKLVGAVGIELSQEFSKSGVFTVLRRFPETIWSQMELSCQGKQEFG